jgi:RHS repeat-associated protein
MSGLAQASCQLTRVRDANSRSAKGWPRNRTKYSYDANGNATARQGNSIVWSSYNYPTTVNAGSGSTAETVAFSYGPDRSRWQQMYTGNGTSETTNYVGGLMEVVSSGSTTTYRHYIYAGSEPVAVYARSSAGNTFSYALSDHQGSVSDLTNSSGTSIVNKSFTPFGQRRNPTTWSGAASNSDLTTVAGITRQGYTFQTQLGLWMGMNHMNGRVEDAITGRMLSADPHVPDGTDPQSYNQYSYANNNPLTSTDPSGFCTPAWACKQDAGSGLGKCRVCGGSDPGDAGFNNSAMQQFAAASADPDQGFLAGLDDIASSLANPIDQSRGCLIGCPSATVDLTPPTTCAPGPENGGQGICTVTVCAHCQVPIDLSPFPTGIPSVASLTGQQPQTVPQGNQPQQLPEVVVTAPYPTRMFGTHWCGPGGAGPPVNDLDEACQLHDMCYGSRFSAMSNFSDLSVTDSNSLQACNQLLCNAARQSSAPGSSRVNFYFSFLVPGKVSCGP